MKKAIPYSVDTKNGILNNHFNNDPTGTDVGSARATSSGGFTSNLSRKKAIPPQPAKKFVIKLLKGLQFTTQISNLINLLEMCLFCLILLVFFIELKN